jgi:hypothetical protein
MDFLAILNISQRTGAGGSGFFVIEKVSAASFVASMVFALGLHEFTQASTRPIYCF